MGAGRHGSRAPLEPEKFVLPLGLGLFDSVLVAHRPDAGEKVVGVGLFGEIQQIHAIFDVLGGLPVSLVCLVAVV